MAEFITVGVSPEERARIGDPPKGHGILGLLIRDPRPIRLPDLGKHPDSFGFPPNHPPMTSFLGVPVMVHGEAFGNLYLTDKTSGAEFTDVDQELVVALAAAAGVAIDNARLHARVRDVALLEDRERIAMDLHDTVIQQLFAVGLSLQGTIRLLDNQEAARRLHVAVDDLDDTIKRIRSTIFALDIPPGGSQSSVRRRVLALAQEMQSVLGFDPRTSFEGAIDTSTDERLADEVVAVLREALSNVARHADATAVDIDVSVTGRDLIVRVVDDGVGMPAAGRSDGRGLRNLRTRAEHLGGAFTIAPGDHCGTTLEWSVPLTNAG